MTIQESKKIKVPDIESAGWFIQRMLNRITVGHVRYGAPDAKKKYLTRLTAELKAYKKTGNEEQLLNIAVYCWLESLKPENPRHHFNSTVGSVTRK